MTIHGDEDGDGMVVESRKIKCEKRTLDTKWVYEGKDDIEPAYIYVPYKIEIRENDD